MVRIIAPILMIDVRAYPEVRLTNNNSPTVRTIIKNFENKTGFIRINSIRKKRITKASENNSQTSGNCSENTSFFRTKLKVKASDFYSNYKFWVKISTNDIVLLCKYNVNAIIKIKIIIQKDFELLCKSRFAYICINSNKSAPPKFDLFMKRHK